MIKNAKTSPKRYYGLHMVPGLAEYRQEGKEPNRILIEEPTLKAMDPSFEARPVYVGHVDQVSLENLENEMDGVVVKSFWNKADGKFWVEFLVTTDNAHQAIAHGWTLSNAYTPTAKAPGGLYHGVEFQEEIKDAIYDHLAIVQDPRYAESVIYTPEQFKEYNERKEKELQMLTNEIKGDYSMLNFFKRTKVENSADFETTMVCLPKSKKEYTISDLVKNADAAEEKKSTPQMCNGEDMVKVGENTMSVNELVAKHLEMMKPKQNADDENLEEEEKKQVKKNDEDDMQNDEDEEEKKKKNEEDEKKKEAVKKNAADKKARFDALKNAHNTSTKEIPTIECSMDQLQRGKARYGSG